MSDCVVTGSASATRSVVIVVAAASADATVSCASQKSFIGVEVTIVPTGVPFTNTQPPGLGVCTNCRSAEADQSLNVIGFPITCFVVTLSATIAVDDPPVHAGDLLVCV